MGLIYRVKKSNYPGMQICFGIRWKRRLFALVIIKFLTECQFLLELPFDLL